MAFFIEGVINFASKIKEPYHWTLKQIDTTQVKKIQRI